MARSVVLTSEKIRQCPYWFGNFLDFWSNKHQYFLRENLAITRLYKSNFFLLKNTGISAKSDGKLLDIHRIAFLHISYNFS